MDIKGILKAVTLELRHVLEGNYDAHGNWKAGDLERRLAAIGVRRDRGSVPVDELPYLALEDREARRVIDAFVDSRVEASEKREEAIAEFIRDAAYTWANRLLALRCMEARGLIDEVILQKDAYGGRSLQHNRLARKQPERCVGEDEGLFATLFDEFKERATELALLFNPNAPEVALRPSVAALKHCVGILSGVVNIKGQDPATDEVFTAPDALGWTYQYWNTEEKNRVDEWLKSKKGFKCEGVDIIYKTGLYTEPYMVKFLVQNSLGAIWMGMHPDSRLSESWEYYVRDADRVFIAKKAVSDITFLDPACGSGHFLVEAFELLYAMYVEEGTLTDPEEICTHILERNLYGIDIDERAIQIAALALVMKAKEKAPDFVPRRVNLVATNIHLPNNNEHLNAFLEKHPEDAPLKPALIVIFESLAHADELGSLLQLEEPVEKELRALQAKYEAAGSPAEQTALWRELQKPVPGKVPAGLESHGEWKERTLSRIREHFQAEAAASDLSAVFFGEAGLKGISLVEILSRRYDVVAANPPYLGSQNMGSRLKIYIQKRFVGAKRDLYAAFILRCLQLSSGRTAMVTQQSWMFLKQMHRIRARVFASHSTEILGHLGPGAFEEISGAHVNVALFVIAAKQASKDHHITALRPAWDTPVAKRSLDLAEAATRPIAHARFRILQSALASLPLQPFVYWCSDRYLELLRSRINYAATAEVGYTASANQRFVRFHWETPASSRWRRYSKGGGFRRWAGLDWYVVDWDSNGQRPAAYVQDHYAPDKYSLWIKSQPTATPTVVRSEVGSGAMGARLCPAGSIISRTGPGILDASSPSREQSLAFLNCRVSTYLLRLACSGLHFAYPYVAKLHRPKGKIDPILIKLAIHLSEYLATVDPCEYGYSGDVKRLQHVNAVAATLCAVEGILDQQATACFAIDDRDRKALDDEVGISAGKLPVVAGYDSLPPLPEDIVIPTELVKALAELPHRPAADALSVTPLVDAAYAQAVGESVVEAFEPSEVGEPDDSEDENDTAEAEDRSVHSPMPITSSVETVARREGVHPLSVYWILQKRKSDLPMERAEQSQRRMSLLVLRLLGHRWPKEIECGTPVPSWADGGGIIPLTDCPGNAPLLARVRDRIAEEFGAEHAGAVEREFEQVIGKPMSTWLASDFFKHHISQFRKRPIALQLVSSAANGEQRRVRGGARRAPAFSCLVYYHRLNADLLPKLRTQYIGPLRMSFQTELGSLEKLKDRNADQDARRLELENKLEELKEFDARLERVIVEGFASPALDRASSNEELDRWTSRDGRVLAPETRDAFLAQEQRYEPDLNDGVRVNIAPFQRAGLLAVDVLAAKDVEKAVANRAEWRADERRWCREGKLPRPGWWPDEDKAS